MPFAIRDQATLRQIGEIVIRDATNTARTVNEMWARDETNVLRLVYQRQLRLVASPTFVSGAGTTSTIVTGATTVGVAGGTAPYTHSWAVTDVIGAATFDAVSPSAATTQFIATGVLVDASATARDTVTDASGTLVASVDVLLQVTRVGTGA